MAVPGRPVHAPARKAIVKGVLAGDSLLDAHTHAGIDPVMFLNGDFPYGMSAEDMLVRLDAWGIGAAACFPMLYSSFYDLSLARKGRLARSPGTTARCPYEFENEHLCREIYEVVPGAAGRLLPFAFFDPGRRQKEQAACIRDLAAQYPVFGLKTATSYLQSHVRELLSRGECLLDLAAALDLPVTIHSAVLPDDPWANVFDILEVARLRPDVRFCIAHTCRFDRLALELAAELPNCFVDFSAFHIHCLLALKNHPAVADEAGRFPGDYRDDASVMSAIAGRWPSTMVWGTDTPAHYWFSRFKAPGGKLTVMHLPCGRDTEINTLRKLPAGQQRLIARTNTLRLLFGKRKG